MPLFFIIMRCCSSSVLGGNRATLVSFLAGTSFGCEGENKADKKKEKGGRWLISSLIVHGFQVLMMYNRICKHASSG